METSWEGSRNLSAVGFQIFVFFLVFLGRKDLFIDKFTIAGIGLWALTLYLWELGKSGVSVPIAEWVLYISAVEFEHMHVARQFQHFSQHFSQHSFDASALVEPGTCPRQDGHAHGGTCPRRATTGYRY
jgi:hypothetical protein